jgi:dsDNA-specific endonuclease/ATPase MutS2
MESRTITMLELDRVLQHLSQEAVSVPGQEKCLQLEPLSNILDINSQSRLLGQAMEWQKTVRLRLDFFPDLEPVLGFLNKPEAIQAPGRCSTCLDREGLWAIFETLRAGHKAWQQFSKLNDAYEAKAYPELYKLGEKIS